MRKIDGHKGPIWIEDETIDLSLLPPQSNKKIAIVCPDCLKRREAQICGINRVGHSYCQPCRQRISAYGNMIGQKIGRLTITGFGEPATITSGGDRTTLSAICDCGTQTVVFAQSVKRAIKKSIPISCGCYGVEQSRQQGLKNAGSSNGMYRHDLTLEERVAYKKLIRHVKSTWGKAIRRRDSVCVICGSSDNLAAHHLYSTVNKPEFCLAPENGITLCYTHHFDFHCSYMGHIHTPTAPTDFYRYLKDVHNWSNEQIKSLVSDKNIFSI